MSNRRCWARFVRARRTWGPTPGVREAWHQGCRWYHVWVLRLDDPAVLARRDDVLARLGSAVVPFSVGSPHVTVWVRGWEAGPAHPLEGEGGTVEIGGANSFLSCPFLEVRSPWIRELRRVFVGAEERWAPYRPHLTIGRYAAAIPTRPLVPVLRPLRRAPWLTVRARLEHAVVDALREDGELLPWAAIPAPTR